MIAALRALGLPVREVVKSTSGMSMTNLVNILRQNPGGVATFGIRYFRVVKGKDVKFAHYLYASWSRLGGLVIRDPDRQFRIYRSVEELVRTFGPRVQGGTAPLLFIPNALLTNLAGAAETVGGLSGLATLAVQLFPVIKVPAGDDETATQALMVREALTSREPQPETAEDLQLGRKYHPVVRGDWLSKLAEQYYGNMHKWPVIFAANRQTIGRDPDLIRPGQRLLIPNLPHARLVGAAKLPGQMHVVV
jgi:hypothetical protein